MPRPARFTSSEAGTTRRDDDAVGVGVLQSGEDVPRQRVYGGEGTRPALHRFLQALAFDPVADPVGEFADDAGVVDVPDGRMIQLGQRLGLPQEPGADLVVRDRS